MGELKLTAKVRAPRGRKSVECEMLLDSGSTKSFIRADYAASLGGAFPLPRPVRFRGIGDGAFESGHLVLLNVCLGGVWVDTLAYVVPSKAMDERVILGTEFMQEFGIILDMKRDRVLLDVRKLKRGHYIH